MWGIATTVVDIHTPSGARRSVSVSSDGDVPVGTIVELIERTVQSWIAKGAARAGGEAPALGRVRHQGARDGLCLALVSEVARRVRPDRVEDRNDVVRPWGHQTHR